MSNLSQGLISQFVKATRDPVDTRKDITAYGTIVENDDGTKYVQLDGSDLYTPVTLTVEAIDGERVMVLLKNHTAIITGNISSPTARVKTVTKIEEHVTEYDKIIADMATITMLDVERARIKTLETDNLTVQGKLVTATADIDTLKTNTVTIDGRLTAAEAAIKNLNVDSLNATYANIDFSNITEATMANFYAKSGLIKDVTVSNATVTGKLVGVSINGDLIEADTLVANKLVILGEDGLYYRLNTDGVTTTAEQTDYNSLNGKIITAKSITATHINVSDLVAFNATIGGFNISENSIYSGVKSSVGNTTRGIYLDNTGQAAFGDASNYLKYFKDTDGVYKLVISASDILFGASSKSIDSALEDVESTIDTITAKFANYSTTNEMNASIQVSADSIKSTVSATYATKTDLDDLEIGGRNLIQNSTFANGRTKWAIIGLTHSVEEDSIFGTCLKITSAAAGSSSHRIYPATDNFTHTGGTYTLSFYAKTDAATTLQTNVAASYCAKNYSLTTSWQKFTHTYDASSGSLTFWLIDSGATAYITRVKLEKGDKHTDWTAAPEDIETRVLDAETRIVQNADSIAANVTETTALGTRMSTVEQTASDLTVRLATAESDIDTAQATANSAKTGATAAAKTATDYLNLSSAGLVVGQNPSNPSAGNTLISADGVTIRKGTTILAAFKAASRTASGISSATLTSTDSTDSESDGTTRVSGTITSGGTRSNVYISTNGNPVYFLNGLETDKVLINNSSGIISNANIVLNGSLVDKTGEGIFTPCNSYGNTVIGYGRYQDGGATHVYGTLVKAKTKSGFSASVNGVTAIDTNNSSGNATFGWHLYEAGTGETNIYGQITSLFSKGDIRLNADGNSIRFDGNLVPYTGNKYNLGTASLSIHDIYISCNDDNTIHGLKFSNTSGSYNAVGINADGYQIYGNTDYCTNIIGKSTTTSSTGYSFKIVCGNNPALTIDDNDARLLLFGGTDSTSRYLGSMAIYKRTYSNAGNIYITANGMMGRSTSSSERYKKDIVDLDFDVVKNLYDLPIRQFKYRTEFISADDERYERDIPGFIAEEVAEYLPIACDHIKDQNGDLIPEMWNSKIIIPALLKLIQDLNGRLKDLEERSS